MTAGGEAHDSEALRVDAEVNGVFTNILYGTLDVAEGIRVLVTTADEAGVEDIGCNTLHAIFQDKSCDALTL